MHSWLEEDSFERPECHDRDYDEARELELENKGFSPRESGPPARSVHKAATTPGPPSGIGSGISGSS